MEDAARCTSGGRPLQQVTIGLDLGTSGIRAVAVDPQGQRIAQVSYGYSLLTPQPGWTEQHPADWVNACLSALKAISQQLAGLEVLALGLSGQMHGMTPLDAEGEVVRPAILWNDQRTGEAIAHIEARIPRPDMIERTGNPAITGFQLAKIIWMRAQEPQAFARTQHILLPKDYLGYVLTGEQVTEPSDASGVGCLNLHSRKWDADIFKALDLNASLFPSIVDSRAIAGYLQPEIAAEVGLPAGLPIVAGGGDNAAAAIGLGISSAQLERGSLSLGSSGVIFAPLLHPTPDLGGRVHLFCHADGGYHLLGVTLAAGDSLRWYREVFAPAIAYDDLIAMAAQSPPGSRGVLFLPHLAGERTPYLDPEARGAWSNLALAHNQSDLIRAVLEGVAYSLRAALGIIQEISPLQTLIATGGGARSRLWLRILTDTLGMPLAVPSKEAGAAYGAAVLAMIGVNVHSDLKSFFRQLAPLEDTFEPTDSKVYEAGFNSFQRLYDTLKASRANAVNIKS